jgi:biofilm PGA synthesis N-glycosyltransferase PgaC
MHQRPYQYVLITPARNEAAFIEQTIKSVVGQTVRPAKWVIVSDGSTDGTDDIVNRYAAEHGWIELVRMPGRMERHFAGKVHAFNAGYAKVNNLKYDIIGSLDADLSFGEDHFAFLLRKFAENPRLGVAGLPFKEGSHGYDYRFTSIEHVSGHCQLFRRECYEAIGGYVPVEGGGIDLIAVLTARMRGWETRTFTEKYCLHHRNMGTAKENAFKARFRDGQKDYTLGAHPLWEICRSVYQATRKPYFIGGFMLLGGYVWCMLRGVERAVSSELMRFRRKEQMHRLREFFKKSLLGRGFGNRAKGISAGAEKAGRSDTSEASG